MENSYQEQFKQLKQQAEQISAEGDMTQALYLLEEGEKQAQALNDPLALALMWRARANIYHRHYHNKKSLQATEQAVTLYQLHGTPFDVAVAQTVSVYNLGILERYDEALTLADAIRPHFVEFPYGMTILNSFLAQIYSWMGQYDKALSLYKEAQLYFVEEGDQIGEAEILHNMGVTAQRMDNLSLAEDYFNRAYPLYKETNNLVGIIKTKSNLAKLCIRRNQLQKALQYLNETRLDIRQLPDSPDIGRLDLFEGRVRRVLNQPEQASVLLQSALIRFQQAEWGIEAAEALIELGHVLTQSDNTIDLLQAIAYMKQAEQYLDSLSVPLLLAQVRLEQAELFVRLERSKDAEVLIRAAEQTFTQYGLIMRQAQAKVVWADSVWQVNVDRAKNLYEDALTLAAEIPLIAARCWLGLGRIALKKQDVEQAEEAYLQVSQKLDFVRNSLTQHSAQIAFLDDKQELFEEILTGFHQQSTLPITALYRWVERLKARSLADLLLAQPLSENINENTNSLWVERKMVIAELDKRWATFLGHGGDAYDHLKQRDPQAILQQDSQEKGQLQQLQLKLQSLDEQIELQQTPDSLWHRGELVSIAQIQEELDESTLLLSYYVSNGLLHVLTMSNRKGDLETTNLKVTLHEVVRTWKQGRRHILRPSTTLPNVQKRLSQFWQWLIQPIYARMRTKSRLLILPLAGLFHIPFCALYNPVSKKYMIEQWQIQTAPSATVWYFCQQKPCTRRPSLLIGFPGIEGQADYLPAVMDEISAIKQQIGAAEVLIKESASYASVITKMSNCGLLHLAGHIYYDAQYPLQSGMPLANGQWLRARDLYYQYGILQGATVVLSGCESGRIQAKGGDILGLSSGFLFAGAKCLISGLWKVADQATSEFMIRFYKAQQQDVPILAALQDAQNAFIQHAEWRHPYYWAAFNLMGAT